MYFDANPPKLFDRRKLYRSVAEERASLLDFIEYHACRLVYPEKPYYRCQDSQETKHLKI